MHTTLSLFVYTYFCLLILSLGFSSPHILQFCLFIMMEMGNENDLVGQLVTYLPLFLYPIGKCTALYMVCWLNFLWYLNLVCMQWQTFCQNPVQSSLAELYDEMRCLDSRQHPPSRQRCFCLNVSYKHILTSHITTDPVSLKLFTIFPI